ncbi:hypothetical protein M407DRAFT_29230 [Tulasnella calospora MUT 4182]|uniref:F-box domain-containing protein n=1 Tax=Tulasnella calospora MUT 4182 TaxID=1051891 RepID=A0A0C3PZU2_9AGAM|nr:hypothetical protein M407DRAFT_29230 [Tulasnella calospora MUT 4182]
MVRGRGRGAAAPGHQQTSSTRRSQAPPNYSKFAGTRPSTAATAGSGRIGHTSRSQRSTTPTTTQRDSQVPELLHLIFTYLPKPSLAACARVNRSWFPIVIEHLWRSVKVRTFLKLSARYRQVADLMAWGPCHGLEYTLLAYRFSNSRITRRRAMEFNVHQICTLNSSSTFGATFSINIPPYFLFHMAGSPTQLPKSLYLSSFPAYEDYEGQRPTASPKDAKTPSFSYLFDPCTGCSVL